MKKFSSTILSLLAIATVAGLTMKPLSTALAQNTVAEKTRALAGLQWKKRPLLLFSKSRSDARLDQQVSILREFRPELRDRDMVVLRTSGTEETRSAIGYTPINRGTSRELRRVYQPEVKGLTVILIGKDGSEKMRWNRVVEPQEIFELIDSMPMRQDEMKKTGDS